MSFEDDINQQRINDTLDHAVAKDTASIGGEFKKGLAAGIDGMQGSLYGLAGLAGDVAGSNGLRDWGIEGYQRNQQEAAQNASAVEGYKDVNGFHDAGLYAANGLGQLAPFLASSIASFGAGGLATGAARLGAKKAADKFVANRAGQLAGEAASKIPFSQTGGMVAGAAQNVGLEQGGIYGDIHEKTGEYAPGTAAAYGLAAGLLDTVPEVGLLGKMAGHGKAGSLLGTVGKQMATEGATEGAQTIVENKAVESIDPEQSAFSPENIDHTIDAALIGAIGGGVMGAGGHAIGKLNHASQNQDPAAAPAIDPNAGPLSRALSNAPALPAPAPALGLPAPDTIYADSNGQANTTGPIINVDGTMQPAQQGQAWTAPGSTPGYAGPGLDQQTPQGAMGRVGEYLPREKPIYPSAEIPDQSQVLLGERIKDPEPEFDYQAELRERNRVRGLLEAPVEPAPKPPKREKEEAETATDPAETVTAPAKNVTPDVDPLTFEETGSGPEWENYQRKLGEARDKHKAAWFKDPSSAERHAAAEEMSTLRQQWKDSQSGKAPSNEVGKTETAAPAQKRSVLKIADVDWSTHEQADRISAMRDSLTAAGGKASEMWGSIEAGIKSELKRTGGKLDPHTLAFREQKARQTLADIAPNKPKATWTDETSESLAQKEPVIGQLPKAITDAAATRINEYGAKLAEHGYQDPHEVGRDAPAEARALAEKIILTQQSLMHLAPARYQHAKGHKNAKQEKLEAFEAHASDLIGIDTKAHPGVDTDLAISAKGVRSNAKAKKSVKKAPDEPKQMPGTVKAQMRYHVDRLNNIDASLANVAQVRGHGATLEQSLKEHQSDIDLSQAKLKQIQEAAQKNGVDFDAILNELGGVPDFKEFQHSVGHLSAEEQAQLRSRHTKLDKTMDLMDDAQIEDLHQRAGLNGKNKDINQKRAALKQEHPDDLEPLLKPAPKAEPKAEPKPEAQAESKPSAGRAPSANTVFTEDAAAKARALLKSKLGQLNTGLDPEILQAGITLAGYHIEKGARTFAAYAKAMTEDLGEVVRPYLKSWYMGVKYDPRATAFDGMSTAAEVEAFDMAAPATERSGPTQSIVTPAGRELIVRPKVVEAADLIASNDDGGAINPAYPQELQPRDRTRASSEMQVNDLAANMNPRLLGLTSSATDGAPIVGPDNVVESGNGRTMAIKRAYDRSLPSAKEYKAWLTEQGYDVKGMTAPVLVRERVTELNAKERQAFTEEANERTTLTQSASERAVQDAKKLDGVIGQYRGGDVGASHNQGFVRAFIRDVVSKADQGGMMDASGMLSQDGRRRMEAALMAKAYTDPGIVSELFENSDNDIRSIGGALLDVSGVWAQMRSEAASGQIPSDMDITPNLLEAVNLIRKARQTGRPVAELVNQNDMFAGALDPVTKGMVQVFYRGENFARARGRDKVAEQLRYYVETARATQPGENLFGDPAVTGGQVLGATNERTKREEEQASRQQSDLFGGTPSNGGRDGASGADGQRPAVEQSGKRTQTEGLNDDVSGTAGNLEPDSANPTPAKSIVSDANGNAGKPNDGQPGQPGTSARGERVPGQRDNGVSDDGATTGRAQGNQQVHQPDGQFKSAPGTAGSTDATRSGSDSAARSTVEQERASAVAGTTRAATDELNARKAAQRAANKHKTSVWGSEKEIAEALPLLLPEQRSDVVKAETRFKTANGMLYTNGTGTGKTASGLGIGKRFMNAGKDNIIIVVPSDKIASDWMKFGQMLDMDIKQLASTKDNGQSGPVITSYANFGDNPTLAHRDWDLVITDEAHYLSSAQDGDSTKALEQLRAITGHHAGYYKWVRDRFSEQWEAYRGAEADFYAGAADKTLAPAKLAKLEQDLAKAKAEWDVIDDREQKRWVANWENQQDLPKVTFLSATPFAYVKNVEYAEGYLFHFTPPNERYKPGHESKGYGYNQADPREQFYMQHFGYRMRYNKLTSPEAGVNLELLEQQFNQTLKDSGALSGRRLEVNHDYDRKFVLIEAGIGKKIDEAFKYLGDVASEANEKRDSSPEAATYAETVRNVAYATQKAFDYQSRMYLLESIKARAVVPIIKQHIALGRKVVVFHDYNKGGGFNPFERVLETLGEPAHRAVARKLFDARPDLFKLDFSGLYSPIETLSAAFPNALFFNGTVPKKQRRQNADLFNTDTDEHPLIVLQSDAGREGVSLHDTTGKYQRVLINLGLPVRPVASTQIEGRTYRTGQASDSPFRYLTTGTAWEAGAFASKIAERAATAENLALGVEARGLKQSFIDAYEQADEFTPSLDDGKGGKEYDRAMAAGNNLSGFSKALTYYYAQQKNTKRRDQREGTDYYATPEPLGYKMVEWSGIQDGEKGLEPSAGHGAIARFFPPMADVTMVEPSYDLSERAGLANGRARIENMRFEDFPLLNKYHAIVMNPPYGHGGKTAMDHVAKAARHLAPGGRIVALIPRGGMVERHLADFLASDAAKGLQEVANIALPGATFERAGTSVNTQILILERTDADILPLNVDLSNAASTSELFERIEHLSMPARVMQESAPIEDAKPVEAEKPAEKPAKRSVKKEGPTAGTVTMGGKEYPVIEHVTSKGKTLYGVIRPDLKYPEAKAIDPHTWKVNGGYFIRSHYLVDEAGAPRFQRKNEPLRGASVSPSFLKRGDIEKIAVRTLGKMATANRVVVTSYASLPQAIREKAQAQGAAPNEVRAVHYRGTTYIVENRFESIRDLEQALFHEHYVHFGLRAQYGKDLLPHLTDLFEKLGQTDGVINMAKEQGLWNRLEPYYEGFKADEDLTQQQRDAYLTEELLAHMGESTGTLKRMAQEWWGKLRAWLRRKGYWNLASMDAIDLIGEIRGARKAARKAGNTAAGSANKTTDTPRFQLKSKGKSAAFDVQQTRKGSKIELHDANNPDIRLTSDIDEHAYEDYRVASASLEALNDARLIGGRGTATRLYLEALRNAQEHGAGWSAEGIASDATARMYDRLTELGIPFAEHPDSGEMHLSPEALARVDLDSIINQWERRFDESGDIMFSRSAPTGQANADLEALRKLGLAPEAAKGVLEQLRETIQGDWRGKLKAMKARANEGIFDGLAGIKQAEESVGITGESSGYVSARLATGLADVMHGVLHYGAPQWKDGVLQYKPGTKGMLEVLADLGGEHLTDWLGWVGAKRAELLKAEGRENNLTDAEIKQLITAAGPRAGKFQKVYDEYAKLNEAVLDVAEQAGLIKPGSREKWMSDYYVPFYRMLEDEDGESQFLAPSTKKGLSHQSAAIKALKGGKLPTHDLLSNILTNWTKRIDASMKNKAMLDIVDNLKDSPFLEAEPNPGAPARAQGAGFKRNQDNIIRVQRDGKDEYYKVKDKALLRAVTAMTAMYFNDPVTRLGRSFKRLLTAGVTASPDFMLRNFIRDSAQAWVTNPDKFKLGVDSIKGIKAAFREDADYRDLMFAGSSFQGGYMHGADPDASAAIIRRALRKKGLNDKQADSYMASLANTTGKLADVLGRGWEKYREIGDKFENANRLATYKNALAAGKSKRQAAYEAKDLMDFSMRGNFSALIWLTDVVPFLNARLQGLGKLGRAYKDDNGKVIRQVVMKAAYLAAFSLMLAALNNDDDRYKQLPDWDKDANWHFWLSSDQVEPIRIPKPFELGLLFGTLPERLLHMASGEQDANDLGAAVARGVVSTLAINPIPQFYMPIRDVQANKSLFFGTPIESFSDEGKLPEARYNEQTSLFSRALGQVTGPTIGLSPKQLDYLIKGYTGTMGAYVLSMSDQVAHSFESAAQPALTPRQVPLLGTIWKGNSPGSTQYQTDLYEMMQQANEIYATAKAYRLEGRHEEAKQLVDENRDKLKHRESFGLARQQLGTIRKLREQIYRDETMDSATKRERLDQLKARENAISERVAKAAKPAFS